MLSDLWPPFGIVLRTPHLELRLPSEPELARLAEVAAAGVHAPGERPFLTPWTEGTPHERALSVLQGHWSRLGSWTVDDWALGLCVFREGEPLGMATVRARDFRVRGEVSTWSWLGLPHQSRGYGTQARAALLTLAFEHLGATDATSEAFQDNAASQGVSRRLGYLPDGISRDRRGHEVVVSGRLRITAERWRANEQRPPVQVEGLGPALHLFV